MVAPNNEEFTGLLGRIKNLTVQEFSILITNSTRQIAGVRVTSCGSKALEGSHNEWPPFM